MAALEDSVKTVTQPIESTQVQIDSEIDDVENLNEPKLTEELRSIGGSLCDDLTPRDTESDLMGSLENPNPVDLDTTSQQTNNYETFDPMISDTGRNKFDLSETFIYSSIQKNFTQLKSNMDTFEHTFDLELNRLASVREQFNRLKKQVDLQNQLIELLFQKKTEEVLENPVPQSRNELKVSNSLLTLPAQNEINVSETITEPNVQQAKRSGQNSRILCKQNMKFKPLLEKDVKEFFYKELKKLDPANFHLKHRGQVLGKSDNRPMNTLTFECARRRRFKCPVKFYVHYSHKSCLADFFRTSEEHNH